MVYILCSNLPVRVRATKRREVLLEFDAFDGRGCKRDRLERVVIADLDKVLLGYPSEIVTLAAADRR